MSRPNGTVITSTAPFPLFGFELTIYTLDSGERVFDAGSVEAFFAAIDDPESGIVMPENWKTHPDYLELGTIVNGVCP